MFIDPIIGAGDHIADRHQRIVEEISTQGWSLMQDYMEPDDIQALNLQAEYHYLNQDMFQAGIGRSDQYRVNRQIRSDHVLWLKHRTDNDPLGRYFQRLETLKTTLNRNLFLGLFDLECHMAVYPVGAYYARHLDCFQASSLRTLTCILYLNQDWKVEQGGQLRLYTQKGNGAGHVDILPRGGQLISFLSNRFEHEVLPARRRRASISGWFRKRPVQAI
jgi:SM-20-related protein